MRGWVMGRGPDLPALAAEIVSIDDKWYARLYEGESTAAFKELGPFEDSNAANAAAREKMLAIVEGK